eukprot:TRINITY_DN12383_c0_g1_i1.p1 TRINITY_DN12383_c0_g1~~TRINITY_DN12383_c0_g1_i1.p1  ORF type:complete len:440 (-),score=56.17 TRINITY_DN12383_c0_g1_i1:20-1339(-)
MSKQEYNYIAINEEVVDATPPKDAGKQKAWQSVLSMVKAVVGAGSFALPWGVSQAGLIGGGVGLVLLGLLCYYTIRILIDTKNSPNIDWKGKKYVTYADLAEAVLGKVWAAIVLLAIIITSMGACAAYLVFNGQMLNTLVPSVSIRLWAIILGIPLAGLSLIKSLKYLAFTSIIGDCALVLGFTTVFVIGFQHGFEPISDLKLMRYYTYPQFFGAAAFLFCVHMLMIPLEQSLEKPQQFNSALGVNFVIVTVLNFFFAVFGYMFYGAATQPLILSNLGTGVLVTVTEIALVFDLFFTFLIVLVPAKDVIETTLESSFLNIEEPAYPKKGMLPWERFVDNSWTVEIRRASIRITMVLLIIAAGCSVNQFTDLTNLVSGISLTLLAFILPPLMYIKTTLLQPPITNYKVIMVCVHTTIMVVGGFAAVVTTWSAVVAIIADF